MEGSGRDLPRGAPRHLSQPVFGDRLLNIGFAVLFGEGMDDWPRVACLGGGDGKSVSCFPSPREDSGPFSIFHEKNC